MDVCIANWSEWGGDICSVPRAVVTLSFKAKIECISLCVSTSIFTHKATNSEINSMINVYYIESYYKSLF
jgi:hypothetical protein